MKKKKTIDSETNWSHMHDFPIEEVWGTCHTLAHLITPRLISFRDLDKHVCAPDFPDMQSWNKAIQKMIDGFELLKYSSTFTADEYKTVREGLDLFSKYYLNLWD